MREWMVVIEYLNGRINSYEYWHKDRADEMMKLDLADRRITLMRRDSVIEGIWRTVYYIDKEGRHDLSE